MAFDVEQALVEWVPTKVGAPCYAEVPDPRPARFVTVERTGGEASLGVDRPLLAVQAWADTAANASALALELRDAIVVGATEIPQVCRCDVTSVYRFPDPDSRQARYQLDVSAVTRM